MKRVEDGGLSSIFSDPVEDGICIIVRWNSKINLIVFLSWTIFQLSCHLLQLAASLCHIRVLEVNQDVVAAMTYSDMVLLLLLGWNYLACKFFELLGSGFDILVDLYFEGQAGFGDICALVSFSEVFADGVVLSGGGCTSGEKKSTFMEMSMGVGVGCFSPKLTRIEEASGIAASIIYLISNPQNITILSMILG